MQIHRLPAALLVAGLLYSQQQPNPKTLISQAVIGSIVDEVSGTLAYQHILDLAGYEHDRLAEEYATTYREAAFVEKMAKQYGLEDVHIERFQLPAKTWDGEIGELWMVAPEKRLLLSYRDVAAALAPGSKSGDVTAELVYVGRGDRESDYAGKDVAGKIVLGSGPIGQLHARAVQIHQAAGILSMFNPTGKPIDRPDQIAWSGIAGRRDAEAAGVSADAARAWGFNLSLRLGTELTGLLERGIKVTIHAVVKTSEYDATMQVPTCLIHGDGSSPQEVVIAGHLFEHIAKQGALDDASGSAVALEVARAWMKLIRDGVLPRPRRTVRFLWVDETQGTRAYLDRYPEEAKNIVTAIAMDMVGEDVSKNRSSLHLFRTPYSVNTFLNDVAQQFFEYVGDTNREKVHNRAIAYAYGFPILDPQGSRDQFYFGIEKYYGSSDHTVFLDRAIPAVLFNNWPDIGYHTSEDRPFNADPTQLKRVLFIALCSAHVIATAGGPEAVRIAETTTGYAAERAASELRRAIQAVGDAGRNDAATALHEALVRVREAYSREKAAIVSAKILSNNAVSSATIDALATDFAETGEPADVGRVKNYSRLIAGHDQSWVPTASDEAADRLVPVRKSELSETTSVNGLTGYYALEARAFADGKRTILNIRDALSAEFGSVDSEKVLAFFRSQASGFDLKSK